jgi:hypothetical protein
MEDAADAADETETTPIQQWSGCMTEEIPNGGHKASSSIRWFPVFFRGIRG